MSKKDSNFGSKKDSDFSSKKGSFFSFVLVFGIVLVMAYSVGEVLVLVLELLLTMNDD